MSAQNLVSASLAPETKTEIIQKLTEVKTALNFLLTLQPDEVRSLFKAANGFAPLIDKAYHTVIDHPEIMPGVFDMEEFKRDYTLSKDLAPIVNQIKELAEGLEKTQIAINSDALTSTMDIYAAVKQNRDKVPGLNVVAEEMAEFFPRRIKKAATPA
ncbi:MAG: hypothetical protein GXY86_15435 [Firmicutes bacterium]|nr:hypothetical protein [Bacillota bacterium]